MAILETKLATSAELLGDAGTDTARTHAVGAREAIRVELASRSSAHVEDVRRESNDDRGRLCIRGYRRLCCPRLYPRRTGASRAVGDEQVCSSSAAAVLDAIRAAGAVDSPLDPQAAHVALCEVGAWCEAQRAAACAGLERSGDSVTAAARAALRASHDLCDRAPYAARACSAVPASAARRALAQPSPIGVERAIIAARSSADVVAVLSARPAPPAPAETAARVIALVLLSDTVRQ